MKYMTFGEVLSEASWLKSFTSLQSDRPSTCSEVVMISDNSGGCSEDQSVAPQLEFTLNPSDSRVKHFNFESPMKGAVL